MRAPSSFHSTAPGLILPNASSRPSAVWASMGRTGWKSWSVNRPSPEAPRAMAAAGPVWQGPGQVVDCHGDLLRSQAPQTVGQALDLRQAGPGRGDVDGRSGEGLEEHEGDSGGRIRVSDARPA